MQTKNTDPKSLSQTKAVTRVQHHIPVVSDHQQARLDTIKNQEKLLVKILTKIYRKAPKGLLLKLIATTFRALEVRHLDTAVKKAQISETPKALVSKTYKPSENPSSKQQNQKSKKSSPKKFPSFLQSKKKLKLSKKFVSNILKRLNPLQTSTMIWKPWKRTNIERKVRRSKKKRHQSETSWMS